MGSITWLLATRNQGKIKELNAILKPFPIEVVGLDALGIHEEAPETGASFRENAMQKARFYWSRNPDRIPVLSDDSGLEVDALNGMPGIHSSRFGGLKTHEEKVRYLLGLMSDVPDEYRTARFSCAATYFDGWRYISAHGTLEGYLAEAPVGEGGFGYDPIFQVEVGGLTMAQISMEQKNEISHRGTAFKELVRGILKLSDVNV